LHTFVTNMRNSQEEFVNYSCMVFPETIMKKSEITLM
jgi:hypothetical protein